MSKIMIALSLVLSFVLVGPAAAFHFRGAVFVRPPPPPPTLPSVGPGETLEARLFLASEDGTKCAVRGALVLFDLDDHDSLPMRQRFELSESENFLAVPHEPAFEQGATRRNFGLGVEIVGIGEDPGPGTCILWLGAEVYGTLKGDSRSSLPAKPAFSFGGF